MIIKLINNIIELFKPWFAVDTRALGLYRIVFGLLCLSDIVRRFEFIDIFYTGNSIIQTPISSSMYKNFSLLNSFTLSWEVHLFFIVGMIFSIMLIIGYRTKLSQIMCAIIIISIHNRATMLENAGDFYMNCMLVWSTFLPLGISFSVDSLNKSLFNYKEQTVEQLNDREKGVNKSETLYLLAFFCMLYQLATIYFFTGLDKTGYDWSNGSAVYKMFQLDTFLTPVGYYLRDYITFPVSKFFTYSTLGMEYIAPLMLFIPFYSYIFRFLFIIIYSIFHISIRIAIKVGLFSYILMSTFILLIDKYFFNKARDYFLNKYKANKYILFYDSDCGFCHFSVRIIKRLDIFHRIVFADNTYTEEKPKNYKNLSNVTAMLYNPSTKQLWIKHQAFGKVLILIPMGFLIGWVFFIPGISYLCSLCYDQVAKYRTNISIYLGMPACGIKSNKQSHTLENSTFKNHNKQFIYFNKVIACICLLLILRASINYSLSANDGVNNRMEDYGYGKKYFQHKPWLKKIVNYPRMIQRWNMFSPTVLTSDKTVIVEATLDNGDIINPFTGQKPIIGSLEYNDLWHDHNQFWRKFFSRVTKKGKQKYVSRFESWIKNYRNEYFSENLNGQRIKSVKIWSLSQRNSDINKDTKYRVSKKLLNSKSSKTNESKLRSKNKLKKKP